YIRRPERSLSGAIRNLEKTGDRHRQRCRKRIRGAALAHRGGCVTSRYRVMHVVHGLDVGGLEVMLNRMVKRLDASRFQSMMCCFDVRGSLAEDFEEAGIRVSFVPRKPRIDYRYPF